jgi:hypothetical protein
MTTDVIGRVVSLDILDAEIKGLPAKVDTGAYRSSIWATNIREQDGTLYFTLLGPDSDYYTGKELSTKKFKTVTVENSFGDSQQRYSIFLQVKVGGREIRSNFTLADRAAKTYPALIGRKMLKNRFIVDVSKGKPLDDEEKHGDNSLE